MYAVVVDIEGERYTLALPRPSQRDRLSTVYWQPELGIVGVRHGDRPDWPEPPAGAETLGQIVVPGTGS